MNGVIYAINSPDPQAEKSIEEQIRKFKEFAERNDISVIDTYIDHAASTEINHRPNFQRMIRDSKMGIFDRVIVYELNRISKCCYDIAAYKDCLKKNGVRVVCAKESISDRPETIILEVILKGYEEYLSGKLMENTRHGKLISILRELDDDEIDQIAEEIVKLRKQRVSAHTAV